MKSLLKILSLLLLFVFSLAMFLPKQNLYNLLEQKLEEKNIIVSNELREENLFSLDIENVQIYLRKIETANIKNIDFETYLLFSKIEAKDIELSNSFKRFFSAKINSLVFSHNIFDFSKMNIEGRSELGDINGFINLLENKVYISLTPLTSLDSKSKKLLRKFKLKDGKYTYESRF